MLSGQMIILRSDQFEPVIEPKITYHSCSLHLIFSLEDTSTELIEIIVYLPNAVNNNLKRAGLLRAKLFNE